MLEPARGLPPAVLAAVAELDRQVVAADGGRLKLEWGTLQTRSGEEVEDLLWWQDERLVGFLGRYLFGGSVELAGMVAPGARRRGIGSALLEAALTLCRDHGLQQPLLVVPRPSRAGADLARRYGGVLHHSEHALVLAAELTPGPTHPRITLRQASAADADVVGRLLEAGFGKPVPGLAAQLAREQERTLLVELDGSPVGTLRLTRDGQDAGIYGFVVEPARRGRGIGGDVLRRVCRQLRAEGAERVGLEVAVDNERALGLYTSVGFRPVVTEDYYALP